MSTPSELARDHKSSHLSSSSGKAKHKKHYLRNTVLVLIVLAALVLWQLNPIISGLGTLQHGLHQAEATRTLLGGIVSTIYTKIQHLIAPLLARIWH